MDTEKSLELSCTVGYVFKNSTTTLENCQFLEQLNMYLNYNLAIPQKRFMQKYLQQFYS